MKFGFCLSIIWVSLFAAVLSSCYSMNGSQIDTGFLSSQKNPFTSISDFSNPSLYNYNAGSIYLTGGACELTSSSQTDQDDAASDFGGGTFIGTLWDGQNSFIRLKHSGTPANNSELDSSWAPAWSHIVGYWKLDEAAFSTNVADGSGNGNAGTVHGGSALGEAGKIHTAASLDGTSGYLSVPDSSSLRITNEITMTAWVKPTSLSQSVIAQKRDLASNSSGYNYGFWIYNSSGNLFFQYNDGAYENYESSGTIMAGTWSYVAVVFDKTSNNCTFYINGAPAGSSSVTGNLPSSGTAPLQIGAYTWGNFYFDGSIDEMAIWNTALTSAQIQTIYSRQAAKYAGTFTSRVIDGLASGASWLTFDWSPTLPFLKELPDLGSGETNASYSSLSSNLMNGIVGLWHLDETTTGTGGAGKDFKDESGNNNWGSLSGGVTQKAAGALGNAVSFDGSSGYIGTSNRTVYQHFTISAWVYPQANPSMSTQYVISKASYYALSKSDFPTGLYIDPTGTYAHFFVADGSSFSEACGVNSPTFATNTWHFLTGSYDGSKLKLFLDGQAPTTANCSITLSTNTQPWTFGNASQYQVGSAGNNKAWFKGRIDEVALWNRALSDSEILELYRRGSNRIKYQIRSCPDATCSTNPSWQGPDGTNQTYFSELNNNAVQSDGGDLNSSDSVLTGLPSMLFSNFTGLSIATNRYFQYRAILESDDAGTGCDYGSGATWCSPELQKVSVGPTHYDNSSPAIYNNQGVPFSSLSAYTQTLGSEGCAGGVTYNLSLDQSLWYYYNGSAWVVADGSAAQSSTAAQINSNVGSFASQVGTGRVYFKAFLHSSGTTACQLKDIEIDGIQ